MDQLTLRPASAVPFDELAVAFNRAYEGYFMPIHMDAEAIASHIHTNDIALEDSLVARDPDGAPVGIAFLGVRGERGWVGGVGIAPEWRGKGWGKALMRALIERARLRGLSILYLEVLEPNTVAHQLYERLGFHETRLLDIFIGPLAPPSPTPPLAEGNAIAAIPLAEALAAYPGHNQIPAPWQRESARLAHPNEHLQAIQLTHNGAPRSYLLYSAPASGGLVLHDFGSHATTPVQRRDDALALLHHLRATQPEVAIRAVNYPPGDPLDDALRALNCPLIIRQHEMALDLR